MKRTRNEVQGKASRPLTLQFDSQPLTAFSGLILFLRIPEQSDHPFHGKVITDSIPK